MQDQITELPTALALVEDAGDDLVVATGRAEPAGATIEVSNDTPKPAALPENDVVGDSSSVPAAASTGFDYATVITELAANLRHAADRVRKLTRAAVIEVGRELRAVKDRLEHGQFVAWVQDECQMNIRAAERAMLAAELVEKDDKLSYLPADGLLALGARSAPEMVVTEIKQRIHSGERPSAAEIKREIEEAKLQAKRAASALSTRQRKAKTQRQTQQQPRRDLAQRETATTAAAQLLHVCLGDRVSEFLRLAGMGNEWAILSTLRDLAAAETRARLAAETEDPTEPMLPLIGDPAVAERALVDH